MAVVALIAAYLLGTIPSADIASRLATSGQVDLRQAGSGNPGATNAATVLGARWGIGVLIADIAKAVIACMIGRTVSDNTALWAGTAAVIGHCLPVWNRFWGGKGVACSAGQCLATFPVYFPIDLAVAYGTARWKRQAFTATAVASTAWIACGVLWWTLDWPNGWGPDATAALPLSAAVSSAVIMAKFIAAQKRNHPERSRRWRR